jgi:hypothetical protein
VAVLRKIGVAFWNFRAPASARRIAANFAKLPALLLKS